MEGLELLRGSYWFGLQVFHICDLLGIEVGATFLADNRQGVVIARVVRTTVRARIHRFSLL